MWKKEVGDGEEGFEGHEMRARLPGGGEREEHEIPACRSLFVVRPCLRCELVR